MLKMLYVKNVNNQEVQEGKNQEWNWIRKLSQIISNHYITHQKMDTYRKNVKMSKVFFTREKMQVLTLGGFSGLFAIFKMHAN